MEFVVTQGQVHLAPVAPQDENAPEGSVAGYILSVTDAQTGIVFRLSMEHHNAAKLGEALVAHTSEHPEHRPTNIEAFQSIPGGLAEPGGNGT